MESGDGGWIRPEAAQPGGGSGLGGDDGWPVTVTEPSAGKRWGRGSIPRLSAWVAAAVAVVAAAAGAAVGLFLVS